MAGQKKILIIGGGIGGLAAAIALRRKGFDTHIFEQADELKEIGAGLSVWPNGTWVLGQFGLLDQALEQGSCIERVRLQTSAGKLLVETDAPGRRGTPSMGIHRADLHSRLIDTLPRDSISLGMRFESLEESNVRVAARFGNGHRAEGDMLVGADGLFSSVRRQILGSDKPIYRGYQAWRGVANYDLRSELPGMACEVWGAGKRFGFEPLGGSRCFWYATTNGPQGTLGESTYWEEVTHTFGGWANPIPKILEATAKQAVLKHEVFDRDPVRRISTERVTLLGDAANPTTPNLGQGACMALEDAFVLAECVAGTGDVAAALQDYESRRYRRRRFITLESRRVGWLAQCEAPAAVAMRTLYVGLIPAIVTRFRHGRYYAFPS